MVKIRPWLDSDFSLLERLVGDPVMTQHNGGPETPEQISKRHKRYLEITTADSYKARTFAAVLKSTDEAVGWVGYWESQWRGQVVYETGWSTLPAFQGRGFATQATRLAIEKARAEQKYPYIQAIPSISNLPSNALCKKLGFTLVEECDYEYPPGNWMRGNYWRLELFKGI